MIRLLKRLADWLDARFPPKVTVTKADYDLLHQEFHQLSLFARALDENAAQLDKINAERIAALEKSVAAIKELLAKLANPTIAADSRRADFIAQGRLPAS